MEEALSDLYLALPAMDRSLLYIKGYTEALEQVQGVRIFPSVDFMEAVPFKFRRYFEVMLCPFYYVPIKLGRKHFGFVLKGPDKLTSRFSTYYPYFNLDALVSPLPYLFVGEGIKDGGIFLTRGHPYMGMLTSGMSEDMVGIFKEFNKTPIFVQDNDTAGDKGMRKLSYVFRDNKLPFLRVVPFQHKDFGDYYDHPEWATWVEMDYQRAVSAASTLMSSGSFLKKPSFDGLGFTEKK